MYLRRVLNFADYFLQIYEAEGLPYNAQKIITFQTCIYREREISELLLYKKYEGNESLSNTRNFKEREC